MNAVKILFTVALASISMIGMANGNGPVDGGKAGGVDGSSSAEVTYVPAAENHGLFHVVYNNEQGSRFVLQILDQDGNQLYQKVFTDKKFDRNYQLADPDGYNKLVFVIHNLGDRTWQRFEVEAKTHLIVQVDVRELK